MANSEENTSLADFLARLRRQPESIAFNETIAVIEQNYRYSPTQFQNGSVFNDVGQNAGSCKIFAFGKLNGLSEAEVLACFGHYYRDDVLKHPDGQDHQNIRQFMQHGWQGVRFEGSALVTNEA